MVLGGGFGVGAAVRSSPASDPVVGRAQWSGAGISGGGAPGRGGWGGAVTAGGAAPPSTTSTTSATDSQETGVVDITVVLSGTEKAAGTGMLLTSTGEVLTNRHVVQGETSISVTVVATGRTYGARVVGISTTTDVAVVQLQNASGLATVRTSAGAVQVGDAVTGVGNAGGTGGTPSAAAGTVTGVGQTITASDDDGTNSEQLTGLVETDANIQPGDSGGPLLDASDAAVGMDTAASSQGNDGYAIPIATALTVAHKIEAGAAGTRSGAGTSTATQRAYLGVEVTDGTGGDGGAQVLGVVQGSPADDAGLAAGDIVTSVAGRRVADATGLTSIMASVSPGHRLSLSWVDPEGQTHSAKVVTGAAQS